MTFDLDFNPELIVLTVRDEKPGLLAMLTKRKPARDLGHPRAEDRLLLMALADLRALGDEFPGELAISPDRIEMSHRLAASLEQPAAEALGLPPLVDMTLRTDVDGIVGSPAFKLRHEWVKNGQRQLPLRIGAILRTTSGPRRLPIWMMEALDVAEAFKPGTPDDATHWSALARFRQALDPGVAVGKASLAARVSMTDFLSGLQVRVADRFSLAPHDDGSDFDVVPFSGKALSAMGLDAEDSGVSESAGELIGNDLKTFQSRVRGRGALPAYRIGPGNYLVIDQAAAPALEVIAEMQRAPSAERSAFVRNPRPRITDAIEADLRRRGGLNGLSPEAEEEAIERAAGPLLVETREFSERVTGIKVFEKMDLGVVGGGTTTWLPEMFERKLAEALAALPASELTELREFVGTAISEGRESVDFAGEPLPARDETLKVIDAHIAKKAAAEDVPGDDEERDDGPTGPIVLESALNFEELRWEAKLEPRVSAASRDVTSRIRTAMMQHQTESLAWQQDAWAAGLPGILNADEQGLGKTLQTIAFLAWLQSHMATSKTGDRGPILVVAPTSLLENWEQEVSRHLEEPGLGHLIRLYGSATGGRKLPGAKGRDIETGESKLDLNFLHEAIEEGRAHRFWLLTTYTTLTNYQHSLARIRFSALVFDEIQALKNPDSLRAHAARSLNADFRIGLTGTPIENSSVDLWALTDQLAPGSLDSLKEFRQRYGTPDQANMSELHDRVFKPTVKRPPLALRRLKEMVARDLPTKTRKLHPRLMPGEQAIAYEDARLKLAQGGAGAALKMLHHIRTVSVHPALEAAGSNSDFIGASGRLAAAFDILRMIAARRERVLVFIEHRQMQYRFLELARAEFGLNRIDLINGDTPISQRQGIVNRFQRHLDEDGGFDMLVLGPKAAGTGLTLTAATHVIHLSRWWNPAVEEQCNDRIHRLGQTRPVTVHVPMAIHPTYRENSFDCLLHSLMQRKRKLAASALWPMGDTEGDAGELQRSLAADQGTSHGDPVRSAISAMFLRDQQPVPAYASDGSIEFL